MSKRTQIRKAAELLVATVLTLLLVPVGSACAEEWVVVPTTAEDDIEWTRSVALQLANELRKHEIAVRSPADAAKNFEANDSRPAAAPTERDIEAWTEQSRRALRDLARKDYAGALTELQKAQAFSRSAVDALNRNPEQAERLLDICLYTVRALLGAGRRAEAQAQAEKCARLSLRAKPNALMHPPDVREFYKTVVEGGVDGTGSLLVEADRAGCDVRLNGISQGRTPQRIERLLRGLYDVQVECDEQRSRAHRVEVASATSQVFIDTRFDRSIRTEDALWLSEPSWPDVETRVADALRIAHAVNVDVVVLMGSGGDQPLELWATTVSGKPRAFVRVASEPEGPPDEALAAAAQLLAAGQCFDLTGLQPVAVSCQTGRPEPSPHLTDQAYRAKGPPRGQFISGVTLASLGTASLLTSYALTATAGTSAADDMVAFPSNDNQARWLNLRSGMYYTGATGAALLVAAMPLALPYHRRPPWWAWLCGGAGVALAATSITLAATAPSEPDESRVAGPQGYVDRAKRTDPAFATGVTAAPLLTVPLVYLLRRDEKRTHASLAPQVFVSRTGGFFALEGRY